MIFSMMQHLINAVTQPVDDAIADVPPTTVIVVTAGALLFWQAYRQFDRDQASYYMLSRALRLPVIHTFFKKEVDKMTRDFEAGVDRHRNGMETLVKMPEEGWSAEKVLDYFGDTREIAEGKDSGCIYVKREREEAELYGKVFALTERTNPMHDAKFPRIKLAAAQVVAMCRDLFHGGQNGHGIITGGGTFSIIEACHAYVSYSRKHNAHNRPVIILPESAHPAFHKAAEILHARLEVIPVDPATGAVDCKKVEKAIKKWGSQVSMLVGSAPSFPYGVYDPIQTLSDLALKYRIPLHVDACLGGFLAAFIDDALPAWDFTVPGVTSLSADTHKYGGTAKGSSVLIFREGVPYTTVYAQLDSMCGLYVTEGMSGSQAGHAAANVFAVLCHRGRHRYMRDANAILSLKDRLVEGIKAIDGLVIPYEPQLSVMTFEAVGDLNILLVADYLKKHHWEPNVVMAPHRNPSYIDQIKRSTGCAAGSGRQAIHFCLTSVHTGTPDFEKLFLTALQSAVRFARDNPDQKPGGTLEVYGSVGSLPVPTAIGDELGRAYTLSQNNIRQKFLVFQSPEQEDKKEDLRQRKRVTFNLSPTRS